MIELPFHNDFFSLIEPENKEEIVEHCLDPALELPKEDFEWGDECLSEKVHLKLTGFTELLKPYITEVLNEIIDELSEHIVLYYSGISRSAAEISDGIINEQNKNVDEKLNNSLEAMKITKQISHDMKDALIKGDILKMAELMNYSWEQKKRTAKNVSNSELDEIFQLAIENKAIACKLSGAGGGGFSIFIVDPLDRHDFISFLKSFSKGFILNVNFSLIGCKSWRV